MRNKLSILLFLCLLTGFRQAHAQFQTGGNCSIIVCEDYDGNEGNILGIFTGYKASALYKDKAFKVHVSLQDFALDVAHTLELKFLHESDPKKNIMNPVKSAFYLDSRVKMHHHTANWTVYFEQLGLYQIQVFVDGKLAGYLNFDIK